MSLESHIGNILLPKRLKAMCASPDAEKSAMGYSLLGAYRIVVYLLFLSALGLCVILVGGLIRRFF